MTGAAQVSVVMSVYNGAAQLPETLDSVLSQRDCDLELIVVNDGSSDDSPGILDRYAAKESRLRVIHQRNTGLTLALATGCAEASGEFIARQDAGDISLPGRLVGQLGFLRSHPQAVMCCGGVRFVGPLREPLFQVQMPMEQLDKGLRQLSTGNFQGPPHHGATMFRADAYRQAGGYRLPFVVAQDIDLWLRLSEIGQCLGLTETMYEARVEMASISSRRRKDQLQMCALAIACTQARNEGRAEPLLADRALPTTSPARAMDGWERARFHYFVASCLRSTDPVAARRYYWMATRENPLHFKALLRSVLG